MKNLLLALVLLVSFCTQLHAQDPFYETYFSANYPKPTGEIIKYIRTPKLLYVHASTPYTSPIKQECVYALNPEGQRVWHSFDWDFEPGSELMVQKMFLASDGALYLMVQEVINFSINKYYLIRAHGGSGAVLWKLLIPNGKNVTQIFERITGEIGLVYYDPNIGFHYFLKTLSTQNGAVLRDQYLSDNGLAGIAASADGNLIFASADSVHRVNGLDPSLVYWRTRMPNLQNWAYQNVSFTFNSSGETVFFLGVAGNNLNYKVEAVLDVNTGLAKITREIGTGDGTTEADRIVRGDTLFICWNNYNWSSASKFNLEACRTSDGKLLYEQGYEIIDPATGKKYNQYSLAQSIDMDRDGNLYLAGCSSADKGPGIMGIVKVNASNGAEFWNKTVDLTPGGKDALSYGAITWCPPSNNKWWVAGMIQVNPNLKSPVLFELDKNTAAPLDTVQLGGNYDFPSGTLQFLSVDEGYCALIQVDNSIAIHRYDPTHQLLWKKEIRKAQLLKAGGLYKGLNNTVFVTGTNYYTPSPTGGESPLKVDSLLLYQLDLTTGNVQHIWKVPALTGGYPVHVAAESDTLRFFVHADGYRRAYRIINNIIPSTAIAYQSITDPLPLLPLKTTYFQRGRETVGRLSPTQYMVWFPNAPGGNSYNYPATTGSVQVSCIAAINGSRDIVAAGKNSTTSGSGLFRFKPGATTLIWQTTPISSGIQRIIHVPDSTLFTASCSGTNLTVMKFSAVDGKLLFQKVFPIAGYQTEINDLAYDTINNRLLLCGSLTDSKGDNQAWLLQLNANGGVTGQIRRDGDSAGPANRAFCIHLLPSGQFLVGGQMQRNGLDTAAFIWNGIPEKFFSAAGRVYCDLNNNNQKDADESAYQQTVSVLPGGYHTFPNALGAYRTDLLATGSYEAGVLVPSPHYSVKKVAFSIQTSQSNVSGADIRLVPLNVNNKVLDAAVSLAEIKPARFGFETTLSVSVQNLGSAPADSLGMQLDCGPQFIFSELEVLPGAIILPSQNLPNGALQVLLKAQSPLQQRHFVARGILNTFLLPGDSLLCTAGLSTFPANDVVGSNNHDTLILVVQGAYDPNDIKAYPEGGVRTTSLAADGSLDLTYRIRFENTGTTNTEFLRVVAAYSPLLRPETFRLGATSAPCTVRFLEGNRIEFSFPQYALSPASLDSIGSKGFVFYQMRTTAGLVVGDTIHSTASIYFDFNPPILTNTAATWIEASAPTAIDDLIEQPALFLYPNPVKAGSLIRFSSALLGSEQWQMFNAEGTLVAEGRVGDGIRVMEAGVYGVVCGGRGQRVVVVW